MGKLIVFEGIDGSGKTTQLRRYRESLLPTIAALSCAFPGDNPAGRAIREMLKSGEAAEQPRTMVQLYTAALAYQVDTVVLPALAAGYVVLCDRFYYSCLAYQGFGQHQNLDGIRWGNEDAAMGLKPDVVLLFDLPAEIAAERRGKRATDDAFEEKLNMQARIRAGYIALAREHHFNVIDASQEEDEVFEAVEHILDPMIFPRGG